MIRRRGLRRMASIGVLFAVVAAAAVAGFGFVVMNLWNWLVPELFGGRIVTFWQAMGLLVLGRILFGGLVGRRGHGGPGRFKMRDRWEKMTPEEREKFRLGMRRGCGGKGHEEGEAHA